MTPSTKYGKGERNDVEDLRIEYVPIDSIKPYEKNPRINDAAVDKVAASIKEFGFKQPIVVDKDGVIIVGHTRLKAAKKLKLKKVPVAYALDLNEEQVKAYRLADNKTNEFSDWDFDLLDLELGEITDINMEDFGFEFLEEEEEPETENIYTSKVDIPQYEPSGKDVKLTQCLEDREKYDKLIEHIKASNISDEEKEFLILASARHLRFNYKYIADYYAGKASEEMQALIEENAMVIIDYNDACKNGYAVLRKTVTDLMTEDGYGEE